MINIVPTPKFYKIDDESFNKIECSICTYHSEWDYIVSEFVKCFEKIFSVDINVSSGAIELCYCEGLEHNEYKIESDNVVRIYASSDEGILYGLASLLQLIQVEDGQLTIPKTEIRDYPDKDYRAFMVDLGRIWHPFDKLIKFVDMCFLFKIKYLHLHFIDVNKYCLPSKEYPLLPSEGEHYTFEQIEYLNEYAKAKGVIIVPEYECPGHAVQFNKKYPEIFSDVLDVNHDEACYNELGDIIDNEHIICAGSEEAWAATKALLKEICDMFPDSPYINIGADEAVISVWKHCKRCRDYMQKNNIADEYDLYSEYVGRVASYILELGKTPLVWEGFPSKGSERIPKETIVIAWESHYNLPDSLLNDGFRIINASWQPLYVVPSIVQRWNPIDIMNWNVYNWQHWWPNSEAYLNPINVTPTDKVLGAMLCSWEMGYDREIPFVLENLSAMCERVWSVKRVCSDAEFIPKHEKLVRLADVLIRDK